MSFRTFLTSKAMAGISMVLVPIVLGIYALVRGQDVNWDLLNYHLYNPYAYLNDRLNIDLAPAGQQTYFNPVLDLVYFFAISHLSPKLVGFLLGALQGLGFIPVYKIAQLTLAEKNQRYALIVALVGMLSVGFISEVGTTFYDALLAAPTLFCLWLLMKGFGAVSESESRISLYVALSGFVIGVVTGLKLVFAIYAIALFVTLLFAPLKANCRLRLMALFAVSATVGLLAIGGSWFHTVWNEFGNPVFPQLNSIFHSDFASPHMTRDDRFLAKGIYEHLFYPFVFTNNPSRVSELHHEQVIWVFAYVALWGLAIQMLVNKNYAEAHKPSEKALRCVVIFTAASYVLWLVLFAIYRYLIPLELILPLVIFAALDRLCAKKVSRWIPVGLLLVLGLCNVKGRVDWSHAGWADRMYGIEPGEITQGDPPAVVYLVGQPIAWIVPALDINASFIQLNPNMQTTPAYWSRAKLLSHGKEGRSFVVMESPDQESRDAANKGLGNLGLQMDESNCGTLMAHMGSKDFLYKFCRVKRSS